LYGTPPTERGKWFSKSTMEIYLEGSAYLGRVLISMFITPSDNPKMMISEALVAKEPNNQYYLFKVQFFELSSI